MRPFVFTDVTAAIENDLTTVKLLPPSPTTATSASTSSSSGGRLRRGTWSGETSS